MLRRSNDVKYSPNKYEIASCSTQWNSRYHFVLNTIGNGARMYVKTTGIMWMS